MASSASHRRTVDAATDDTNPSVTAWAANSDELHRDSGTFRCAGASHAIALTSATTSAGNERGRPDRGRSANPSIPSSWKRRRHRDTTSTCTPNPSAMATLVQPSAANNTILARTTRACGAM